MATTPNFGWVTPAPTDFVTDLPADFETFADAVDADVQLIKNTADAALPETLIDAAGDLIYGSAADTAARLAIGTAGQVLTVNSGATAPEWVDPAGGGGMTLLSTQSFASVSVVDITGISQDYKDLVIDIFYYNPPSSTTYVRLRPENITTSTYYDSDGYGVNLGATDRSYISLGDGISSDGAYTNVNGHRITLVDYTRSYSQSQLCLVRGIFYSDSQGYRTNSYTTMIKGAAAVDRLYFYSGVNLQRGTIKVYGVA